MFLWNNIFFSLGFDIKDHYKDFGGDAAAYTAPVSPPHVNTSQHFLKSTRCGCTTVHSLFGCLFLLVESCVSH